MTADPQPSNTTSTPQTEPAPHEPPSTASSTRRGFITPQPQKRPRTAWIRFESHLPNHTWQADMTHWALANSNTEIITFIDDYSRAVMACTAVTVATTTHVVAVFYQATTQWGFPASVLTDNGAIFTAEYQKRPLRLRNRTSHSRHRNQTRQAPPPTNPRQNRTLPTNPQTMAQKTTTNSNNLKPHTRIRHDKIDNDGKLTLRHNGKLHHICVERKHRRTHVHTLVADLNIGILTQTRQLPQHLTPDPTKNYQPPNQNPYP